MQESTSAYGFSVEVHQGYDEAVLRTRLALRAEGFSIVTEAHVGGMLAREAGDERQYLFMGAWAPAAAPARRDDSGLQVAVHVPCNLVVQEAGRSALVAALDPADDIEAAGSEEAAAEARSALARVLERVGEPR